METWKAVIGYEGLYEVSDLGRVRSLDRRVQSSYNATRVCKGKIMALPRGGHGYPCVRLSHLRVGRTWCVHALVAAAFIGPRPPRAAVRHLNGDQTDNRLTNLAYGTYSENNKDIVAHGRNPNANKTQCPSGHDYDEKNTRISHRGDGSPFRVCRICSLEGTWAHRARKRKAHAA